MLRPGCAVCFVLLACAGTAHAADPQPGPAISIRPAAGPITVDGDLSDPGWAGAEKIEGWFETNPGDNTPPPVGNVGYLTYDHEYFYAGFEFEDPEPQKIRAPLGDHDDVPSSTDYGGVIVDSRNDGKTAILFLANPRGTQYDAVTSDASGEDAAPDFYWDTAGKITSKGWTLELRIPFSSLRYDGAKEGNWRILLYRNYPRDRRFQFFNTRLPRDVNCFICNSSVLTGLADLPHGSHLVVAPYATGSRDRLSSARPGSSLEAQDVDTEAGLDVKWNPTADTAIDATLNPDFSQVESDAAQIVANERFALFFPEKRPFFLEGIDLFATPIQAVYTRTVNSPSGGLRVTGRAGATSYTALVTQDRGGGLVILPGPTSSDLAEQNFESWVGTARAKRDFGTSFVSFLGTAREIEDGGHNRVFGPDFQWRPRPSDSLTGQFLWSDTRTPNRPDLTEEWKGHSFSDHAFQTSWSHSTEHLDWFTQLLDIGAEFRADNGFVPQVGYREIFLDGGYTFRPTDRFLSRLRLFTTDFYDRGEDGKTVSSRVSVGAGMDGRWNSFYRVELNDDHIQVAGEVLHRARPVVTVQANPGRVVNQLSLQGFVGQEIDFANAREGDGGDLSLSGTLRPSDHLELRLSAGRRWLDVDDATSGRSGRLFTAQIARLRGTWCFDARSFLRLIGEWVQNERDPGLYDPAFFPDPDDLPPAKDATVYGQALFAYKVNWQTVLYLGYATNRLYDETTTDLEPSGDSLFLKMSYSWQH